MHLCSQRAPAVKQHSVAAFHILQRKLIVAELHKTELRYVKGLLTLEKIYLPILVCGSPDEPVDLHSHIFDPKVAVITQAQARLIFSHISSICRQNEKFFEELNDLFTHWTADSLLGPLMDDFSTTFLLYTDFVSRVSVDAWARCPCTTPAAYTHCCILTAAVHGECTTLFLSVA